MFKFLKISLMLEMFMGLKLELLDFYFVYCLLGMSFQIFDFNLLAKLLFFALFPKKNHQVVKIHHLKTKC